MEELKRDRIVDDAISADTETGDSDPSDGDTNIVEHSPIPPGVFVIPVPPVAIGLSIIILAAGGISALLMFVWLCFQRPDSANILIPLILTPLFAFLAKYLSTQKGRTNGRKQKRYTPDQKL